jgi:hypothetical protein
MDARRYAVVSTELRLRIDRIERALSEMEPQIDVTPLRDEEFVRARWGEHIANGRRHLLRMAWAEIHIVKAKTPGGQFGEGRIRYVANSSAGPKSQRPGRQGAETRMYR